MTNSEKPLLAVGCPVWSVPAWVGEFYTTSDRKRWLSEYSSVFSTVEGNSVFYALPDVATVERWAQETEPGFEFALKVPREISHDHRLQQCERPVSELLRRLEILRSKDRLGPTFLQLPPTFDRHGFEPLARFLERWPKEYPLAVEARHADYFDEASVESSLDQLLHEHQMDRVLFDSRALFSRPPEDEIEFASQGRKPRSPFRTTVTSQRPMVRFVGRNRLDTIQPWIDEWAKVVANWLGDGLSPIVFLHAPDDRFAPAFTRRFHEAVRRHVPELPKLQDSPVDQGPQQLELF